MISVFKSHSLQREYEKRGYIVVPSLLLRQDLIALESLFANNLNQYTQPFHSSHFSKDTAYKKQVHDAIIQVVYPKLVSVLNNFRPVFGNFMVKNAASANFLQMHADWTYVNEPEYRSVSVWIPLVDTNATNGCLGVIAGSHKFMNNIRGPLIQQNSFTHDRQWVEKYGELLPLKAGDAIIYDHAPAINLSLAPSQAQLIHYCMPQGVDTIQKYLVPDNDFYIQYDNFQTPQTGTIIETLPAHTVKFIDKKMNRLWLRRLAEKAKSVFIK